jgi:hypothetical protein
MNDIRSQLDEYFSYVDETQGSVDVHDVVEKVVPLPIEPVPGRLSGRGGWLVAVAAAVLVLVLIGGFGLLARVVNETDDAPVVDEPVVTTTQPAVTSTTVTASPAETEEAVVEVEAPWSVDDLPAETVVGVIDTPLGPANWVQLSDHSDAVPGDDGRSFEAIKWPSGFAIFQQPDQLWVSSDGIDWHIEPLPIPADERDASLTLVDDVYWLVSSGPASLWRSMNGLSWEEYDLSEVIPGAVGLNWEMDHTLPVTVGDLTLVYASFRSNFPYAEYAPNLTEDGRVCDDHVRLAKLGRDLFQVVEDFGEGPDCAEQPVLRMIETDTGLQVIDNNTGDELGEILGANLNDLAHVSEETLVDRLLIISDGNVAYVEVPWLPTGIVTLFSAGEAVYAYVDDWSGVTVWRSEDGRAWTNLGPLTIPGGWFRLVGDALTVNYFPPSDDPDARSAAWETTDGVEWSPLPDGRPDGTHPWRIESGWFATTDDEYTWFTGQNWWMNVGDSWVSLDETGHTRCDGSTISAVGNTTFLTCGNDPTTMWVLNFEPSG